MTLAVTRYDRSRSQKHGAQPAGGHMWHCCQQLYAIWQLRGVSSLCAVLCSSLLSTHSITSLCTAKMSTVQTNWELVHPFSHTLVFKLIQNSYITIVVFRDNRVRVELDAATFRSHYKVGPLPSSRSYSYPVPYP